MSRRLACLCLALVSAAVATPPAHADDASLARTGLTVERGLERLDRELRRAVKRADGDGMRVLERRLPAYREALQMGMAGIASETPSTDAGLAAQHLVLRGGIVVDEALAMLVDGIGLVRELKHADVDDMTPKEFMSALFSVPAGAAFVDRGERLLARGFRALRALDAAPAVPEVL
ncbi:MAG TPA: hypothetical protein VFR97_04130 [Capillimicrobium sp.]|nr:hypothetical protein [Capillimicrobium sp.]